MVCYRQARANEINPQEQRLATLTREICSNALRIPEPEMQFIVESVAGELFSRQERIAGFQRGRAVYVLIDLSPRYLVETIAHELRHQWQHNHGTFNLDWRERDAKIFEHEFTLELRGSTYDELIRALTAPKPATAPTHPRQTQPGPRPTFPSVSTEFRGCSSRGARLRYCENLLQRLPAKNEWQKNNLREEIAELKKEMPLS